MIHSMSRLMPLSLPLVQSFPRNRMAYGNWSLTSPKHSIQRNVIMKYTIERCSRSWSHFLKQPQKLNHHQAQWLLEPTNYHFTLHYIPSKQNTKADTLLRHHDLDMVRDNENEILLKSEFICSLDWIWDPDPLTFEESWGTSRKSITQQRRRLERVREWAYHFLWIHLHSNSCQTLRRHCLWKSQFHICWTSQLLQNCRTHYTQLLVASSSAQYLRIHRRMWNLSVSQDTLHLAYCSATSSWSSVMTEIIMLDLLGLLPMSNGYNTILIIVDQFTKYVKFEATHVELTAEGFMKVLWDQVFCDHGLPWKIIHNCDTQFVNKYIKALFNLLSIK